MGVQLLTNHGAAHDDVIIMCDGDDFLKPHAVEHIAGVYQDSDTWLTYGSYEPVPHNTGQQMATPYPPNVISDRSYRTNHVCFNHLRTFRKFLFDQLTDEDFTADTGLPFSGGGDYVVMIPMLEMAGDRWQFVPDVLYCYNAIRPDSDVAVNMERCVESQQIRSRPQRDRL
jgi:hypothetical protein